MFRAFTIGLMALIFTQSAAAQQQEIEVGWIAVWETWDLNTRIDEEQPKDYIVWLWNNRNDPAFEPAEGLEIELAIFEEDGGKELWRHSASKPNERVSINRSLALQAGLICAYVRGHRIVHTAEVGLTDKNLFSSCSYRLPGEVSAGRAHGGFGIPLILAKEKTE